VKALGHNGSGKLAPEDVAMQGQSLKVIITNNFSLLQLFKRGDGFIFHATSATSSWLRASVSTTNSG